MVQMQFDSQQYQPTTGGVDVFETGSYLFQITDSKVQETKKKDGNMLVFTATCMEEGQAGKRLMIRLNVQNPSAEAVDIAMRELSAISHVCGVLSWSDTQQLHGRPFRIRLEKTSYKDYKGEDKPTNNVLGYLDANGHAPGSAGGVAQQAGPPAAPPAEPAAPPPPAMPPAAPAPAPAPQPPAMPGAAPQQPATAPAQPPAAPEQPGKAPWE